jgi:hypothetical protein
LTVVELQVLEDLHAQLAELCPFWSQKDWTAFTHADEEQQRAIVDAMRLSSQSPGPDVWGVAKSLLAGAAGVVPVPGLATAVTLLEELAP